MPPAYNMWTQTAKKVFQPADTVVIATFTLNNVRLLVLSKIGTPYDPATAQGTLGKNLTHQVGGASTRIFFDRPLNSFMGTGALGMMIADFDGDHALSGSEGIVAEEPFLSAALEIAPSPRSVHSRRSREIQLGIGVEGRIARLARQNFRSRIHWGTSGVSAKLHGSRSAVHGQNGRSTAPLHARLDRA